LDDTTEHISNGSTESPSDGHDQEALCRSEARYRALVEISNRAVWSWSADGVNLDFQNTMRWWEDVTGQTIAEQHRTDTAWLDMVHPDDRAIAGKAWDSARATGIAYDVEYRVRAKECGWRIIRARGVPVIGPNGNLLEWVGTLDDVTEHRLADASRREGEERLRLALEASGTGVWEWDIVTGRITWSDQVHAFYGIEPGEFDGTLETFTRHLHPEDAERARESIRASVEDDVPYRIEYRIVPKGGGVRWISTSGRVIRDASGKPLRMTGATSDVTERKLAEEARRESEVRFRALFEQAPFSVQLFAPDGRTLGVNRAWEKLWGLRFDQLADYNLLTDPQLEAKGIAAYLRRAVAGEAVTIPAIQYDPEESIPGRTSYSDSHRWVSAVAYPLMNPAGIVSEVVLVHEDITAKTHAEVERAHLTETLSLALVAAELGTWDWDPVTDQITLSDRAAEIYGLPFGQRYTREWMRGLIRPDHRAQVREAARRAVSERVEYDQEYLLERGVWVAARGHGSYDAAGNLTRMLGVVQDVTARKTAEAELRQSEERHRALATATADVVYRMSADWEVMQPLDGRGLVDSNDEPIRGWMQKNLPAFEHSRTWVAIHKAIETKSTFELEHQVNRRDATLGWIFSRAVPILDTAGEITEWFGAARDITERKEAEERLRRSHDTFLNLIQNNPFGVYLVDADFRLARVSLGAQKVFAQVRPLLGRDFTEVLQTIWSEPAATEFVNRFRHTLTTGEPYVSVDTTAQRADVDGVESYDWRIERVPLPDGQHGVVCYFYDMTERRRIEDALKDADRKKDDFIALLAHELRNPLAPIRNGLQVLRLGSENLDALARARDMMDRQLTHMVRLIDDLLDISRINRGKMELRRGRVELADVVGSAVETARPALDAAGHELMVTLPATPVALDADLTRLSQVFSNLLTNSAKYTPEGGRVWLSAERTHGRVLVRVQDTGIGIPANSLPTIFDMFSQVDRSIERSSGGLGIGLALVKGLVEMHGGTVTAASDGESLGTTFTVMLPEAGRVDATASVVSDAETCGPARRILVVDDNRDGAESMGDMLTLLGHEVRTAHDGIEAVELAEEFRPAIILMDVGMPRMNGLEASRRIREQSWGRDIVIVALTGWGHESDRERSHEAGCNSHLVKPVDFADLQRVLAEMAR
jgi:PAS domain S-box-containing protein